MQLQVIRNLELSIRNIHIVYEDKSTKPNHPFAFGITLNYITLHVGDRINAVAVTFTTYCTLLDNQSRLGAYHIERRHTADT
jgi:hypothetical protein